METPRSPKNKQNSLLTRISNFLKVATQFGGRRTTRVTAVAVFLVAAFTFIVTATPIFGNLGNLRYLLADIFDDFDPPTLTSINPDSGQSIGNTSVSIVGTNFQGTGYSTPIVVTNSDASIQNDYQVRFTLDTASLITAGHMRSDCGDLRVKDVDGSSDIPYWLEFGCNTSSTVIWTKVPSLAVGSNTIYTNYGNSSLTSQSNGDNTFIFFDDFESGSIDTTNKWQIPTSNSTSSPYWQTYTNPIDGSSVPPYQEAYVAGNLTDHSNSSYYNLTTKDFSVPTGGNAIIDFWWTVSSERSWDYLYYCFGDGAIAPPTCTRTGSGSNRPINKISGTGGPTNWNALFACSAENIGSGSQSDWCREFTPESSMLLPPGLHSIKFSYEKDGSGYNGTDQGWIDAIKVRKIAFSGTNPITELVSNGSVQPEKELTKLEFCDPTCVTLNNVTFVDSSHLTATTPAHVIGTVDLKVTNSGGANDVLSNAFTYTASTPDLNNSTVSALPTNIEADGIATSTITVIVKDPSNYPIPGILVELNDNGSAITYNPSNHRVTTDNNGRANFIVQSSTVQNNITFTATIDPIGTPLNIVQTASVTFSSLVTSPTKSTFIANPGTITASNGSEVSTLTAHIVNDNNVPIPGVNVLLYRISGPTEPTITPITPTTNSNGDATFSIFSSQIGDYVLRASDDTNGVTLTGHDVTLTVQAAVSNAGNSTLIADINTRLSDGTQVSTLTFTGKDQFNNIVENRDISIIQDSGPSGGTLTFTPTNTLTDNNGDAVITVSATKAGTYVFKPKDTLYDTILNLPVTITFTPPTATNSTLVANPASPSTVISDGNNYSTVTATLKDASGNNYANKPVTLAKSSGSGNPTINASDCTTGANLGGATSTTDLNGQACFKVTSVDNDTTVTFTATDDLDNIIITQSASIYFGNGNLWDDHGKSIAHAIDDNSTYVTPSDTNVIRTSDSQYAVTWLDNRNPSNTSVYVQKFDTLGVAQWAPTTTGVEVYNSGLDQYSKYPRVISDGTGGVIVTWIDFNSLTTSYELRGQKFNSSGSPTWGFPYKVILPGVSTGISSQSYVAIADGAGGAFIGWKDSTYTNNWNSLTRIDGNGDVVLGDSDTYPIRLGNGYNCSGSVSMDLLLVRPGVVRVAYVDQSGNCAFSHNEFITIVTINGIANDDLKASTVSTSNAVASSDFIGPSQCLFTPYFQSSIKMIADDSDGVYVGFLEDCSQGYTSDNDLLYVTHIPNSTAAGHSVWTKQLTTTASQDTPGQDAIDLISDQAGGVIVGYVTRASYPGGPLKMGALYAERLGDSGTAPVELWTNSGSRIEVSPNGYNFQVIAGPSVGTANFVWSYSGSSYSTYGVQFNNDGSVASGWSSTGNPISTRMGIPSLLSSYAPHNNIGNVVTDGAGGFIMASQGETGFINLSSVKDVDNWIQSTSSTGINQFTPEVDIAPDVDIEDFTLKTQQNPQVALGTNGDVITVWEDDLRLSTADPATGLYRIFAEKIGPDASRKWQVNQIGKNNGRGIQVGLDRFAGRIQDQVALAADQTSDTINGGALVAWRDSNTFGYSQIGVQKLDTDGNRDSTWNISEYGVSLSSGAVVDETPGIISDGNGGAFVTWIGDGLVYITKLDGITGYVNSTWGTKNPTLNNPNLVRQNPKLLRDSTNGFVYLAFETRCATNASGVSITLMQYNETSGVLTGSHSIGSPVCPTISNPISLGNIDLDPSGNILLSYHDDVTEQVYAQKFSSIGPGLESEWDPNGVLVSNTDHNSIPRLASDNNGGAILVWEHHNAALGTGGDTASDIVIQALDQDGANKWHETMLTDSTNTVFKINPKIASDDHNGAVIAWEQWSSDQTEKHIFSQHIVNSIEQQTQYGQQLSNIPARQDTAPVIASTGNGSVAVIWPGMSSPPDIFGQNAFEENRSFNSTFTASSTFVSPSSSSILTATLLDSSDTPIVGKQFQIDTIFGSNDPVFTPVICPAGNGGDTAGTTNADGQACFQVSSTVEGTYTFAATDITDSNLTLTPTVSITFGTIHLPTFCGFTDLATGWDYSLGLKTDGTVWTWGDNTQGQLGNGSIGGNPHSTPTQISGLTGITALAANNNHSLAIDSNGDVWAWGNNDYGQLGDNSTNASSVPVQVSGLTEVIAIAAGYSHSVALKSDGTVWAWGHNAAGEIGDGTIIDRYIPTQVSGLSGVTAIAAGSDHSLALKNDGSVWSWGYNAFGQLGDGTVLERHSPVQVSGLTSGVSAITAGMQHSVALLDNGSVLSWGFNDEAELGDGTTTQQNTPVTVTGLTGVNITSIASKVNHTLAIDDTGNLWEWGYQGIGHFGGQTFQMSALPVVGVTNVIAIGDGLDHSLALTDDLSIWAWGSNNYGQLGDGTTDMSASPLKIPMQQCISPNSGPTSGNTIVTISGSNFQTVGLTTVTFDSETPVVATVDSPTSLHVTTPAHSVAESVNVTITNPDLFSVEAINAFTYLDPAPQFCGFADTIDSMDIGTEHALAIKNDGTVWSWGSNVEGQAGNGTNDWDYHNVPAPGPASLSAVTAVAAGDGHSLAILNDGTVRAWGNNDYGQLGDGSNSSSYTPVTVSGLSAIRSITASSSALYLSHSAAVKADGTLWMWGNNNYGQLGDGTTSPQFYPTQVIDYNDPSGFLQNVVAIATSGYHSVALKSDGTVWAWGYGGYGALGAGNNSTSLYPVQVIDYSDPSGFLQNVEAVAVGSLHSMALKSDGTVWAWGYGGYGQLGNGSWNNSNFPLQVSLFDTVSAISADESYSLALLSDGTLMSWGYDNSYNVVPVPISGLTNVIAITSGHYGNMALKDDRTIWSWGYNSYGQLGDGDDDNLGGSSSIPVQVVPFQCVTPNRGSTSGGDSITISGVNFQTSGTTQVTFDGESPVTATVNSDHELTVTNPPHLPAGAVDITITNPDAQTATLTNGFTYESQTADADLSTFTAMPSLVANDGLSYSTLSIVLYNSTNQPRSGKTVTITPPGTNLALTPIFCPGTDAVVEGTSDSLGQICYQVSSDTRQIINFVATVNIDNVVLTQSPTVAFGLPFADPTASTVTVGNQYIEPIFSSAYNGNNSSYNAAYLKVVLKDNTDAVIPDRLVYLNNGVTANYLVSHVDCDSISQIIGGPYTTDNYGRICFLLYKDSGLDYSVDTNTVIVSVDESSDPDTVLNSQPSVSATTLANLNLFDFRFRHDDGTEITATPIEDTNIPYYNLNPADPFRLRLNISRTSDFPPFGSADLDHLAEHVDELSEINSAEIGPRPLPDFNWNHQDFRAHKSMAVDLDTDTLYVPTADLTNALIRVYKYDTADLNQPPTYFDISYPESAQNDNITNVFIDSDNSLMYFVVSSTEYFMLTHEVKVYKVDLINETVISSFTQTYPPDTTFLSQSYDTEIDLVHGYLYLTMSGDLSDVNSTSYARIEKIKLNGPTEALSYVGELKLAETSDKITASVIDTTNQFMYVGYGNTRAKIAKIDLNVDPTLPPVKVDEIYLVPNPDQNPVEVIGYQSAVIDTVNGYAYFGSSSDPDVINDISTAKGFITKIDIDPTRNFEVVARMQTSDPAFFTTDSLQGAEFFYMPFNREMGTTAQIDIINQYAYFSAIHLNGVMGIPVFKIYRIDLNDFSHDKSYDELNYGLPDNQSIKANLLVPELGKGYIIRNLTDGDLLSEYNASTRANFQLQSSPNVDDQYCNQSSESSYVWSDIPNSEFTLQNSPNLTDGEPTNNTSGLLADNNSTFIPGQVKSSGDASTSTIIMGRSNFTEIEYSLKATAAAKGSYCFRVVDQDPLNEHQSGNNPNFIFGRMPSLFNVNTTDHYAPLTINGVVLSKTTVSIIEGTTTDSYGIKLASQPSADVTVNINADDNRITLNPDSTPGSPTQTSLTFTSTDWDTYQNINISAARTDTVEGTTNGLIRHTTISTDPAYNKLLVRPVTSIITDYGSSTSTVIANVTGEVTFQAPGNFSFPPAGISQSTPNFSPNLNLSVTDTRGVDSDYVVTLQASPFCKVPGTCIPLDKVFLATSDLVNTFNTFNAAEIGQFLANYLQGGQSLTDRTTYVHSNSGDDRPLNSPITLIDTRNVPSGNSDNPLQDLLTFTIHLMIDYGHFTGLEIGTYATTLTFDLISNP